MSNEFTHPKIFTDLLKIYKMYFMKFRHFPKLFRVTTGAEAMKEISDAMKLVVQINFYKSSGQTELKQIEMWALALQSKIEILKAYILMAWETKIMTHAFFMEMNNRLEEVSKQTAAWKKWLMQKR